MTEVREVVAEKMRFAGFIGDQVTDLLQQLQRNIPVDDLRTRQRIADQLAKAQDSKRKRELQMKMTRYV
jgi:hypothetical protein